MFPSCLSLPTYLSIIHLLTIFFYSSLCSSRLKNKIWYGLLGSKELLQRSYRKLEERIQLEVSRKGPVSWARRKEIKWPQNHLSTISLVLLKLNSGSLTHSHGDKAWGFISVIDKKIIVWRETPPHLCKGLLCWYLKSGNKSDSFLSVWWRTHLLAKPSRHCSAQYYQLCWRCQLLGKHHSNRGECGMRNGVGRRHDSPKLSWKGLLDWLEWT